MTRLENLNNSYGTVKSRFQKDLGPSRSSTEMTKTKNKVNKVANGMFARLFNWFCSLFTKSITPARASQDPTYDGL